jgi:hypothetical protein
MFLFDEQGQANQLGVGSIWKATFALLASGGTAVKAPQIAAVGD